MKPLERLRRIPEGKWLQLIAAIGKSIKPTFIIGRGLPNLLMLESGELHFFANDLSWMYWKNKGLIALRITRTK
jgi:hypothetical protein